MSDGDARTLVDGDIISYLYANNDFFQKAIEISDGLVERTKDAEGPDEVAVPVESLRMMRQAIIAMNKSVNHAMMGEAESLAGGDTGANCDYNPLKGVNF